MDSLMAVELRLALETRLGIDMPIVTLSDNTSLTLIATRMMRTLSQRDNAARPDDASGRENSGALAETLMRHEATTAQGAEALASSEMTLTSQVAAE
jgi:hypothetical protein